MRFGYGLVSTNLSGSADSMLASNSVNSLLSNRISKYSLEPIFTWCSSSGTTYALFFNSRVWIIFPAGDLNHKPSGTSRLDSVGVKIPLSVRLNQGIFFQLVKCQ